MPESGKWPARASVMEPSPDDTLTMVRVSRFFSSGYNAWVTRKGPTCAEPNLICKLAMIETGLKASVHDSHDSQRLCWQHACLVSSPCNQSPATQIKACLQMQCNTYRVDLQHAQVGAPLPALLTRIFLQLD